MSEVIAVSNQKGGVGKTTSTINLGAALAELGYNTLLVDMDPQSALSAGLGVESYQLENTVYNVLVEESVSLASVIHEIKPKLYLAPSNIDLAAAELALISAIGREYILKEKMAPIREEYDYVLIDCPPSLGLLTINSLTAANSVLIPLQCEYLALRGMRFLMDTIDKVRLKLNPDLRILGILGTMYNSRTLLAQEVISEIQEVFGDLVFDIVVKSSVRFAEAPVVSQSILDYDPRHEGAEAYRQLAEVIVDGTKKS